MKTTEIDFIHGDTVRFYFNTFPYTEVENVGVTGLPTNRPKGLVCNCIVLENSCFKQLHDIKNGEVYWPFYSWHDEKKERLRSRCKLVHTSMVLIERKHKIYGSWQHG